ncbi:hypothetical protein [uncultured Desulfovibrio sp.]|uniref:hypothetical protein n=1 Tax=uncultured Desulfovibrio sp. TaxID=167968 RepID=UPI00258670A9|nr:hypothetical protein [uncultured Desulfovibrio sp.]
MYRQHILKNGKMVEIRPFGWKEYWTLQKERLAAAKKMEKDSEKMGQIERTLALTEFQQAWREKPLDACVKDWPSLQPVLSLEEVREIEAVIKAMSDGEILAGNSAPAAEAAAAAGPNIAGNA